MPRRDILVYDAEIARAILASGEEPIPGIEYCAGWSDYENMGISMVGCWDGLTERSRVFGAGDLDAFAALVAERSVLVSFNGLNFDNRLLEAHGAPVPHAKCYDLLAEIWRVLGKRQRGYGLHSLAVANGVGGKTGEGATAPVLWQQGKHLQVVDYCLNDVALTLGLLELVMRDGALLDPVKQGMLRLPVPMGAMTVH